LGAGAYDDKEYMVSELPEKDKVKIWKRITKQLKLIWDNAGDWAGKLHYRQGWIFKDWRAFYHEGGDRRRRLFPDFLLDPFVKRELSGNPRKRVLEL
jgi:hypothetical protein